MLPTSSATKMPLVYVVLLGQLHTASATCTDAFGNVYNYECGDTCQNTPCTCDAMFDFVNTDSCPVSKPCKTTTGCCGACSAGGQCWAYSCTDSAGNTYCSDAPCDEDCNNSCQSINLK